MLDNTDYEILQLLSLNGRETWANVAEATKMSAPGIMDRIRRLEEKGVIRGYAARIARDTLGYRFVSFAFIRLAANDKREKFLNFVSKTSEIAECHHVTGAHDYLIKILCEDTEHLDLLIKTMKDSGSVAGTETIVALKSVKEEALPRGLIVPEGERRDERKPKSKRAGKS